MCPRFDSRLSNLTRKNYKQADCGKYSQQQGIWQQSGATCDIKKLQGIRTLVWVFPLFKSWDCICKYNFTVGLKYAIIHKRKYL